MGMGSIHTGEDFCIHTGEDFCSGECHWSFMLDAEQDCDSSSPPKLKPSSLIKQHHVHFCQQEQIPEREQQQHEDTVTTTNSNEVGDDIPIRYASEEESEYLSTLEADSEDDASDLECTEEEEEDEDFNDTVHQTCYL